VRVQLHGHLRCHCTAHRREPTAHEAILIKRNAWPFVYPNAARASFGWVDFEHHATTWEHRVAHIAQACAEMYLDADEPGEAIAILSGVVRAIPLNSIVVEALMRAHAANHDRPGAESVYREHATSLEQAKLGDPEEAIEQLRLELQSHK
jgi:DNA-binding SARP family transcriptional activator